MASSSKIRSRYPLVALAAATVTAIALAFAVPAGVASGQEGGIDRSVIPMSSSAPDRYVVQPGDTLWSIAERTFPGDPREGVWELRERNALESALIVPGQVLVLPA